MGALDCSMAKLRPLDTPRFSLDYINLKGVLGFSCINDFTAS
jgi:hypothetical protein